MNRPRRAGADDGGTVADEVLLRGVIAGQSAAAAEIARRLHRSGSVEILVAGGVLTGDSTALLRAGRLATTTRDRQLVILARAQLEGPSDLFDALVRDHLASYPDHLLAAWLATRQL